jgi:hypothetical protein
LFHQSKTSFFEKKEAKKLCSASRLVALAESHTRESKFFLLLFFSKKRRLLLPLIQAVHPNTTGYANTAATKTLPEPPKLRSPARRA